MNYSSDYGIIEILKRFADRFKVCLLVVHHTRKQDSDDVFDTISGTNGLLGAADGAFVMQKENEARIKLLFPLPVGICPNNVFKLNARQIALGIL